MTTNATHRLADGWLGANDLPTAAAPKPGEARAEGPGPVRLAAWLALVAGLAEVAVLIARVELAHRGIYRNKGRDFVWMIPASYLATFLAFGLIAAFATRSRPAWRERAAYPSWALAFSSVLLSIPGLRAASCL